MKYGSTRNLSAGVSCVTESRLAAVSPPKRLSWSRSLRGQARAGTTTGERLFLQPREVRRKASISCAVRCCTMSDWSSAAKSRSAPPPRACERVRGIVPGSRPWAVPGVLGSRPAKDARCFPKLRPANHAVLASATRTLSVSPWRWAPHIVGEKQKCVHCGGGAARQMWHGAGARGRRRRTSQHV